jgi:LPXTG-site transpeptidase (sortase) family protein
LIAAGLLIILGVGGFQLYATLWTRHSQAAGRALVHQFLKDQSLGGPVSGTSGNSGTALATCAAASRSTDPVKGLLEIPKLGVTAPVEDGQDNAQLDVAVGHNTASVWPGAVGNSVLAAHNVSYFVGLPNLNVGDTILYVAPCSTTVFQVTAHTIVDAGAPVYNTPTPTITLVTCWPTNALWFTPQRYLVTAREVRQTSRGGGGTQYAATSAPPTVAVPSELAAQGVTLATYSLPMGSFTLAGTPDPMWAQSTNPLFAEDAGVEAYIAGVRSLVENRLDWWSAFAPGVSAPAPLLGASNPTYLSSLNVTVNAVGTQAKSLTLSNTIGISGGKAPGHYAVTVTETISNGVLTITSWTLQPA